MLKNVNFDVAMLACWLVGWLDGWMAVSLELPSVQLCVGEKTGKFH